MHLKSRLLQIKLILVSFLFSLYTVLANAAFVPYEEKLESPRFVSGVTSIIDDHHYLQQNKAPLYWRISPYYLPQLTDSSCSLASVTMVINAVRSQLKLTKDHPLVTQDALLNRVNDEAWRVNVKQGGQGETLDQLKEIMVNTLRAYHIGGASVEAIHLNGHSKQNQRQLRKILLESERTANVFIIANFNEKFFTDKTGFGHFSPIGAYDATKRQVLIMDTDRELYEPYWVPEKLLLDSMATLDKGAHHHRGYLVIRLPIKSGITH